MTDAVALEVGGDILNVVGELRDAEQGAVHAGVLEFLGKVALVELLEGSEYRQPRPFQLVQLLDLLPQGVAGLVQKGLCEQALLLLAEELGQEAMGVK